MGMGMGMGFLRGIGNESNSLPEVGMGFLRGIGMGFNSLRSTTTALDVRNALATEAECSIQHLTTCSNFSR